MNNKNTTVIICCAGMGTRLGIGTTKALLNINNKPLIIHQLELLKDYNDIRIVIGFQAEKVIEIVNQHRKDIMFVFNYDYENNGPAASLSKALINTRKYIIILDGDVLINPSDFKKFLDYKNECIVISNKKCDESVFVKTNNNMVTEFSGNGKFVWSGIAKIDSKKLAKRNDYIYRMISSLLPIDALCLRTREVDTQDDYDHMLEWVNKGYID